MNPSMLLPPPPSAPPLPAPLLPLEMIPSHAGSVSIVVPEGDSFHAEEEELLSRSPDLSTWASSSRPSTASLAHTHQLRKAATKHYIDLMTREAANEKAMQELLGRRAEAKRGLQEQAVQLAELNPETVSVRVDVDEALKLQAMRTMFAMAQRHAHVMDESVCRDMDSLWRPAGSRFTDDAVGGVGREGGGGRGDEERESREGVADGRDSAREGREDEGSRSRSLSPRSPSRSRSPSPAPGGARTSSRSSRQRFTQDAHRSAWDCTSSAQPPSTQASPHSNSNNGSNHTQVHPTSSIPPIHSASAHSSSSPSASSAHSSHRHSQRHPRQRSNTLPHRHHHSSAPSSSHPSSNPHLDPLSPSSSFSSSRSSYTSTSTSTTIPSLPPPPPPTSPRHLRAAPPYYRDLLRLDEHLNITHPHFFSSTLEQAPIRHAWNFSREKQAATYDAAARLWDRHVGPRRSTSPASSAYTGRGSSGHHGYHGHDASTPRTTREVASASSAGTIETTTTGAAAAGIDGQEISGTAVLTTTAMGGSHDRRSATRDTGTKSVQWEPIHGSVAEQMYPQRYASTATQPTTIATKGATATRRLWRGRGDT